MRITEQRLRRIIRETLLRESEIDDVLDDLDTALTGLDITAAVAALSVWAAPIAAPAEKLISVLAASVDAAQAFRAATSDPPDYNAAAVNLVSAILSIILAHAAGQAITRSAKFRELLVAITWALADWYASSGKLPPDAVTNLKKSVPAAVDQSLAARSVTGALATPAHDYGESDNSEPAAPSLTTPKKVSSVLPPASSQKDIPVSSKYRLAQSYNGGLSGQWVIQNIERYETSPGGAYLEQTTNIKPGTSIKSGPWSIKSVSSDAEGDPEFVILRSADGKFLRVNRD